MAHLVKLPDGERILTSTTTWVDLREWDILPYVVISWPARKILLIHYQIALLQIKI